METKTSGKKRQGIRLFEVGGIEISLDYTWFFLFFLIFWSLSAGYFPRLFPGLGPTQYFWTGFLATILFFLSLLAHELAHSFMALREGLPISGITLFMFGGVSKMSEEARDPKTELKVAVVGPLTSFALAFIFWTLTRLLSVTPISLGAVMFGYLAWVNMALGIFNLLPGYPLDGGRILRALWWWKTGSLAGATKVASDMGKVLAWALMIFGGLQIFAGALLGGIWLIFIGMFLRSMADLGYQEMILKQSLSHIPAREVMIEDVRSVPPDASVEELVHDYFLKHCCRAFPVVKNGKVLGLLTLEDMKEISSCERPVKKASALMTPLTDALIISPETPLTEALKKMSEEEVPRLLVMEDGRMLGMLSKSSLMRFLEIKNVIEKE